MSFQYIAIDGPTGVGKTVLAERLAARLDAALVLEEMDNPFLEDFYAGRPGAALHAQIFFLLGRHRQQLAFRQADLFTQAVVCDYLFDRDRIFAYLNLDDNELFVYQRLYELLAADMAPPDLVIYLQAPADVLAKRLRDRATASEPETQAPVPSSRYLRELNEAYQHFFFHYTATPLLVVDTSQADFAGSDEAVDDLIRQIRTMGRGTMYYVPRR
jgi:deoxyguanosine kinase